MVVSNKQMAPKILRGASVAPEKMSLVLFNSGGVPDPGRTEAVLRVMFPKMHKIEKDRTGSTTHGSNEPPESTLASAQSKGSL